MLRGSSGQTTVRIKVFHDNEKSLTMVVSPLIFISVLGNSLFCKKAIDVVHILTVY
jgi:hypothetical protein